MRTYGQYCPLARAAEIFAERWTPIIVRNLLAGCSTFGELVQAAPGIPRSMLVERLRLLERTGLVERRARGRAPTYHLTVAGHGLGRVCDELGTWGSDWLEVAPHHLDPHLALVFWARLIERSSLPSRRLVVRVDLLDGSRPDRYWVLLAREGNEVCLHPPGEDDIVITTDTVTLCEWQSGALPWASALSCGRMRVDGPPALVRAVPRWGGLSPWADHARPIGAP